MEKEVINSPIRWAGSKKKLLNEMLSAFDKDKEIYVEPFLGSGVVLINVLNNKSEFSYNKYYVNDVNENIIDFFKLLKDEYDYMKKEVSKIIKKYNRLLKMEDKEKMYYQIRERFNNKKQDKIRAVYFWFLMKTRI